MSLRAGNGPRNMVEKLLESHGESSRGAGANSITVDQVVFAQPPSAEAVEQLARLERHDGLDLVVAYEAWSTRDPQSASSESLLRQSLRRLGILRGRPGTGFPGAVHLERFAAPGRVLVTDDPRMTMVGGLGMLAIPTSLNGAANAVDSGRLELAGPKIVQILLSGRLNSAVSARDVFLELMRQRLDLTVSALKDAGTPLILEFAGPGLRTLSVHERALLCSIAPEVGATSALACSDEKTELFLRDQRRSKAHRHLTPEPGSPSAAVIRLDLSLVEPLLMLTDRSIVPVCDRDAPVVRELVLGGDVSGTLRDMLGAAQWFKAKRVHLDVDLVIVPASRQTLEAMATSETLAQLLAAGGRLHVPDPRFLDGTWHPPATPAQTLRSFMPAAHDTAPAGHWMIGSIDTLCQAAINGRVQDPRLVRRATKVSCPRELPIDDAWVVERKAAPPMERGLASTRSAASARVADWEKVPASAE